MRLNRHKFLNKSPRANTTKKVVCSPKRCYSIIEMSKADKILSKVLGGKSDRNLSFSDLCYLLDKIGFKERVKGDHHIYYHKDTKEIINIQPKGSDAKPYQVKQVRDVILKNNLGVEDA